MTDHIRDSIDQLFPPAPPDDPRPDPPTPPDDALPACPVCGGASGKGAGLWHECRSCRFAALSTDGEWRRLSRAMALLRAVERIGRYVREDTETRPDEPTVLYLEWRDGCFSAAVVWMHHDGPIDEYTAGGAIPADALIALAAQLEEAIDAV